MNKFLSALALVAMVMLTTACPDDDPCEPIEHFTIVPGNLAGCGYLLESTGDSTYVLEPLNLEDFIPNPVNGQEVWIVYQIEEDVASACMMGPIVTLLSVSE